MPRILAMLTLALALGCGGGDADPGAASTQPKGPASPEAALQLLADAAKAGDVDQVLAQLTPSLARTKKTMLEIGSEEIVFLSVLERKFGRDITPVPRFYPSAGEWRDGLKGIQISLQSKQEIGPDRVLLTVWENQGKTVETRVMAQKDQAGWKLDYQRVLGDRPSKPAQRQGPDGKNVTVHVEQVPEWTEPDSKAADDYLKALERYRTSLGRISQDIGGGQFPNREAALAARQQALAAAFAGVTRK